MANYNFFDADASILTAGSSVIGSVHYPVVKVFDSVLSVSQGGTVITSLVSTVPSSVIVGASVFGNVGITNPQSSVVAMNAPVASIVSGTADFRGNAGASIAVIAGQGGVIKSYITGVQVANYGSASVLVTLAGNSQGGSILGYTIAPAGGGSNINYSTPLVTGGNQPFTASINAVASVLISAQGYTL